MRTGSPEVTARRGRVAGRGLTGATPLAGPRAVALGVVVGFPVVTGVALWHVPSADGAIVLEEAIRPWTALAALLVVGCVALTRRAWSPRSRA